MSIIWVIVALTILGISAPWILKLIFPHKVTLPEIGISVVVSLVISGLCALFLLALTPQNTELLHGEVTDKKRVKVSCSHSYQCNCYTTCSGTGSNRTCRRVCQTCYEHSYDVDWRVYHNISMVGSYINIRRVDRRGTTEPPRWSRVEINEPFTAEHAYSDYIKLAPNSMFYRENVNINEAYQSTIPHYPRVRNVYDTVNILKTHDQPQLVLTEWNDTLREYLKSWSPEHHVNVIIMFTNHDRMFAEYLKNDWQNGRKNDAVIVVNIEEDLTPNWVEVFSWSKDQYFNSIIKAELANMDKFTVDNVFEVLDTNMEHFERRPMEEFEYLKWEREYAWWQVMIILLIQLGGNVGIAFLIINKELA